MWILLMSSLISWSYASPLLVYSRGDTSYTLDSSKAELVFRQSPVTYRISRKSCNKKMVDDFLSDIKLRFGELPLSKEKNLMCN